MALSNWDTLSIGPDSKPSDGTFILPDGRGIEIYKNWLYIHDATGWHEGLKFVQPIIGEVIEGNCVIAGIRIRAVRGPQSAVFFHAKVDGDVVGGIGCYGFLGALEYLKRHRIELYDQIPAEFRGEHVVEFSSSNETWGLATIAYGKVAQYIIDAPQPKLEELWVGVERHTLTAFLDWLEDEVQSGWLDATWYQNIKQEELLRFNQGDAFFAASGIADGNIATEVESAEAPVIAEVITGLTSDPQQ